MNPKLRVLVGASAVGRRVIVGSIVTRLLSLVYQLRHKRSPRRDTRIVDSSLRYISSLRWVGMLALVVQPTSTIDKWIPTPEISVSVSFSSFVGRTLETDIRDQEQVLAHSLSRLVGPLEHRIAF